MTLSGLQGHASNAGLLKFDFSYSCAAVYNILTDSASRRVASRGSSAIAELFVSSIRELLV